MSDTHDAKYLTYGELSMPGIDDDFFLQVLDACLQINLVTEPLITHNRRRSKCKIFACNKYQYYVRE